MRVCVCVTKTLHLKSNVQNVEPCWSIGLQLFLVYTSRISFKNGVTQRSVDNFRRVDDFAVSFVSFVKHSELLNCCARPHDKNYRNRTIGNKLTESTDV